MIGKNSNRTGLVILCTMDGKQIYFMSFLLHVMNILFCLIPTYTCQINFYLTFSLSQERVIENLREQKDREDRVRLEELEQLRKENHELKDKLSVMQPQKQPQNQLGNPSPSQNQRPDGEVSVDSSLLNWCLDNRKHKCVCSMHGCYVWFCSHWIHCEHTREVVCYVCGLQTHNHQYNHYMFVVLVMCFLHLVLTTLTFTIRVIPHYYLPWASTI